MLRPRTLLWAPVVCAAGAAARFGAAHIPPVCLVRAATGLACPGCGATRAVAAVASGDLADAFVLNPLVFALAACVAYVAARRRWPSLPVPPQQMVLAAGTAAIAAFTVARNVGWLPSPL